MYFLKNGVVLTLLLALPALGSVKSIRSLKDKISNQSNQINKLAAQIQDMDSKISSNNESYVSKMKELEGIEFTVEKLKIDLNHSATFISREYQDTKKAFNLYLLESSDSTSEDGILSKRIYLDLLKKKMSELKNAQRNSTKFLTLIQSYEQDITEKKKDEESIYKLIVDLERNKKSMSQKYVSIMEFKNLNETKLDSLVSKRKAIKKVYKGKKKKRPTSKTLFKLNLPLDSYIGASKSKEGISFKFSETTPIKAPRAGKIVYAGQLSNYGNVLIIDHGQDVRSVLLGDIVAKVKKGDNVQNDQIIGYTVADLGNVKALYFEVRKKNIVQNTVNWISKNKRTNLKI
jgi:murein DD-endopeptidase MepM/ murein hydrolase activator NlpD